MPGMPRISSSSSVASFGSSASRSSRSSKNSGSAKKRQSKPKSSGVGGGGSSSKGSSKSGSVAAGRVPPTKPPPQTLLVGKRQASSSSAGSSASAAMIMSTPARRGSSAQQRHGQYGGNGGGGGGGGHGPQTVPRNHKMAIIDAHGGGGGSIRFPRASPHKNVPATAPRVSRREIKYSGVKRAIEELNKAIGHDRRIAAITNACAEFDHWDETKHNAELQYGSANALSLLLSMSDDDDEIRMICAALEMVFRASGEVVKTSFQEVGSAIVPMLLRLLERCESGNMKHADVSILNISKVLLYFSRVTELRVTLVRHQGLLTALVRVSTSILNAECRTIRMRVLANLANSEDNKGTMLEHTGLVESVLKVAALDLSEGAREYASQALMDLASTPLNQAIMAKNDRLLGTLVKLSVIDDKAETREYAVTALQNLAFSKENRTRLATYGSGVVLEALKKTVSSDPNDKARRRAAGALTNLACEETADRMGCHKGLLETLSDVSSKDTNSDVQERAALALSKIATSVTVEMSCFNALLDALVIAMAKHANGVSAVLRVKARVVENRNRMAHHPGVLETLSEIVINQSGKHSVKDRDNAVRALMHLTNENTNRRHMCRTGVLNALVKAAALTGSVNADARDSAVIAIERLATEQSNRTMMAQHDGLLVVIALATEREAKQERMGEKQKNGQQHLAKQLLMSLLIAM